MLEVWLIFKVENFGKEGYRVCWMELEVTGGEIKHALNGVLLHDGKAINDVGEHVFEDFSGNQVAEPTDFWDIVFELEKAASIEAVYTTSAFCIVSISSSWGATSTKREKGLLAAEVP